MGRVKIRITPSLTPAIDAGIKDWLTLERETVNGATVTTVLSDLGATYPELGRMLFDRESGGLSDEIDLVLNGQLLHMAEKAGVSIKDGDTLTILPMYAGG